MPKQHQKPQKKATQQQQQQHHLGSPTVGPLPTNSTAIETTKTYTTNRPLSPTALDAINIFQSVQTPEKGWYLRNTIEGVHGSLKYGPLPAVVVRAGPRWKCTLDISALEPGWYSIVFCVSFKNMDTKSLQSLTIDARQLDDDNHCVYMAETCKTIISNQELRNISTERFTRLRLDGQIELDACGPMELSFNFGSGAIGSFELRYITLESGQNSIYDQVLYGEGKPQQLISIGHGKGSSQDKTLNVHSYAISSSGYEPESLSDENYFEVVLEKDHFLVLGQTNTSTDSIVEPEEGGCRRLISTRDMSVAKTLSIHQDYEIQYPVPITGPAFTYAQGSIVNIVKDANALTPPRDRFSSCGHDCIMDMLPVDLLLEDETLEYAYNETIVLNMMATQTRIHGSRITVLIITFYLILKL
ncbi:hypothetical protein BCR41DRAFT_188788 [Lobosporangium transversale]|uniref:Uncharacterized protein n=1 Tax=Lobosporangium transversale TaxID=64571 RepID=A0A1Y2GA36_9FUNG|nr:hypothetical protein BCR41DRAFT_188788 [Lobosporangium transversale]ORZ05130.1 hypothetical protein BCR41DRAFT_188788 [Lobosporangium transversale]|eukprot:XP_021876905.1 hypothetical protein BCR41DRAFT_188788 [Lobosporangium transversale]